MLATLLFATSHSSRIECATYGLAVSNRDSACLGRCHTRSHTTCHVKDDRPKQVDQDHQVHHFHPLGKRPHSTRSVLPINNLCGRNSSSGGLIPNHERPL